MFEVQYLNSISSKGKELWTDQYKTADCIENADALLVRSAAMHEMEFSDKLLAVSRAGAGVNNIPLDKCAQQGIVVFNTPGANANGVVMFIIGLAILWIINRAFRMNDPVM